jgi:ABC-type phosphate transport system substrate-binding protein
MMRTPFSLAPAALLLLSWLVVTDGRAQGSEASHGSQTPNPRDQLLAIIVNKSNPVEGLSYADLRQIFLGQRSYWPHGRKITLVMREPGQAEREAVLRAVYGMGERDFNRHFLQAKFTGEVLAAPKLLSTAAGVKKFVLNVPGAIAYVRLNELDDSVKPIHIDNQAPGDPGYKLRVLP